MSGRSRGRWGTRPSPERPSRFPGAQLLAEAAGRAPVWGRTHTRAFQKLFGSRVAPGPPSKGGSLRLPSPLLHSSLDPGTRSLEDGTRGPGQEAQWCSDSQGFVLFSSCSWARLDSLTKPQELGASKAAPPGGQLQSRSLCEDGDWAPWDHQTAPPPAQGLGAGQWRPPTSGH